MENRKRKFVLRVPVTPEERALIQQKMDQLGTKNFSAYSRKMLIDGYIVNIDTAPVRAQTAELQKIGVNINQIARRINSTGTVYAQDLEDIKGALAQIWQLQRSILSSQRRKRRWTTSRTRTRPMESCSFLPMAVPMKRRILNFKCC